jgi:amino acid permease
MQRVIAYAIGIVSLIYAISSWLGIRIFGSSISPSILDNFGEQGSYLGYTIQVLFLALLTCHIPYIFMFAKEGGHITLDEVFTRSMSHSIERKLAGQVLSSHHSRLHSSRHTITTLFLYFATVFIACQTSKLGILFDYVGALSVSGIQFFVPGAVMVTL